MMRPEDNPADEAFERDLMLAEIATLTRQLAEAKGAIEELRGLLRASEQVTALKIAERDEVTAQRDAMREWIKQIRLHHERINQKHGRPISQSATIGMCDRALGAL